VVTRGNLRGITFQGAIARARGYFTDVGIDEQETVFGSGAEQQPAINTGQLDIGAVSMTAAFFNSVERGFTQPLVFDNWHLERGDKSYQIVVRPDLVDKFKDLTDLKGTISASSTPIRDGGSWFIAQKMFDAKGMKFEDLRWERLTFPDMLAAFGSQAIESAWLIEPFITLGKQRNLAVPWIDLSEHDPGSQIAGLVFAEKFIKERPDVARRWTIASVRAARDLAEYRKGRLQDVVGPILAQHTGLPPEAVGQVAWGPLHPDGRVNVESIMASQRQLVEWGMVPSVTPQDKVVDLQFVDYAVQQLGPYSG
jgi:NitT/TauT family transport system substrate-binding protein